jgi:hypothetical protein
MPKCKEILSPALRIFSTSKPNWHSTFSGMRCVNKSNFMALLSICMLAACGASADNPENVPLAGKWRDEGKIMSVQQGGMPVSSDALPGIGDIRAKLAAKEYCGEPFFRNKEEAQAMLDKNNPAECVLESVEVSGNRASSKGVCKLPERSGVDSRMAVNGNASINADNITHDLTLHATFQDKATGMGETAVIEVRQTLTRIGDC